MNISTVCAHQRWMAYRKWVPSAAWCYGLNRSQSEILVLKTVGAFPPHPAREEVLRTLLTLGLTPFSHLDQNLPHSSLLFSVSRRLSERHLSNSAPRVPHSFRQLPKLLLYRLTFRCFLFTADLRPWPTGSSARFVLHRSCPRPRTPRCSLTQWFLQQHSLPRDRQVLFSLSGKHSLPFFAWKVPTHSTISRANVTSLSKLSPPS